jgi:low temperature requirement protein LtrA
VLLVVWWSWNYTTWVTNELDPPSVVVRLLLIALMLASLVMAIAIPEAFGDKALLFAGSYVATQLGRHSFLTFAAADRARSSASGAGRILVWFVAAGALWGDHADQRLWSLGAVAPAAGVLDSRGP